MFTFVVTRALLSCAQLAFDCHRAIIALCIVMARDWAIGEHVEAIRNNNAARRYFSGKIVNVETVRIALSVAGADTVYIATLQTRSGAPGWNSDASEFIRCLCELITCGVLCKRPVIYEIQYGTPQPWPRDP